ncbi:MAG: glycosyltransferase family 4 protein [Blastochloris sp.]|nr:glycosyltransferase family 4 protein [Blastochloris sp.]
MPSRKWPKLKAWLMEYVWAPWAARDLEKTLREVQPDCIWAIPHDWSVLPLHQVLVQNQSAISHQPSKISVHVTIQDFPDCHGHGKLWGEDRVCRMARMQEELYASADTADATSHPMLEELERRTGKRGVQMLHQGLEPEDFEFLESSKPQAPRSKLTKIAYAGTILCEPEFALFVNFLDSPNQQRTMNQESGTSTVELHFWGSHSYANRPWFRPWMIEHGNLPERELLAELRECDWGFIPMSIEDTDPRYNRFSFPTKFITYLAAGLPPIIMGHPESSVMKMASTYDVGLRIADDRGLMTEGRKDDVSFMVRGASLSQEPFQHLSFSAFQLFLPVGNPFRRCCSVRGKSLMRRRCGQGCGKAFASERNRRCRLDNPHKKAILAL